MTQLEFVMVPEGLLSNTIAAVSVSNLDRHRTGPENRVVLICDSSVLPADVGRSCRLVKAGN
jgi:hypothetical protein